MLNTLDGKHYDQWAGREPYEVRPITVKIDEAPERAQVRFLQEEVGGLKSLDLRAVALLVGHMCGVREIELDDAEAAEFLKSCKET